MATPIIDPFDDLYIDHEHDLDHDETALILQREVNALDESLDALIPRLNSTLSSSRRSGGRGGKTMGHPQVRVLHCCRCQ